MHALEFLTTSLEQRFNELVPSLFASQARLAWTCTWRRMYTHKLEVGALHIHADCRGYGAGTATLS